MGTDDELRENQEELTDQVPGDQGQPAPKESQPTEVELPDGTRVSLDELKSGYMKDADYRKKTADVAEERRRLQAERDAQARYAPRSQANLDAPAYQEADEEVNPIAVLGREVVGLKTYVARQYLNSEIDRLMAQYPDADKSSVFSACWSNPNANIENEMQKSQAIIDEKVARKASQVKAPATLDEFFKQNPKAKEEYDKKQREEYMRKKAMKSGAAQTGSSASASSAETVRDKEKTVSSYREATERLKERFKEEDSPGLD